ncbi:MAG TPA: ParA family protein [Gammaproteobacteria bacterium]|nr:ParA family protein [Gammaproteobacteria bacterium]
MRHIMVVNAKGGSGKTTIATNLASYFAAEGNKVVLMDLDPQAGATAWLEARSPARPHIKGLTHDQSGGSIGRNTDYVIMDAPAAVHGKQLGDLIRRAETLIIPVLPSPIDMRAAAKFLEEVKNNGRVARKAAKVALVANRAREYTNVYWELDEFLTKQKAPFITALRDSQNYIRAAERGLGIFDLAPYATVIDREQWEPLIKWLKSKRSQP